MRVGLMQSTAVIDALHYVLCVPPRPVQVLKGVSAPQEAFHRYVRLVLGPWFASWCVQRMGRGNEACGRLKEVELWL